MEEVVFPLRYTLATISNLVIGSQIIAYVFFFLTISIPGTRDRWQNVQQINSVLDNNHYDEERNAITLQMTKCATDNSVLGNNHMMKNATR